LGRLRNERFGEKARFYLRQSPCFSWPPLQLLARGSSSRLISLAGARRPPTPAPGKAHLEGALDTDTNALTWTVTYSGLTGAPIGAHFHGPVSYIGLTPEENAPIQVGTTGNLASPFKGSATIDEAQKKDLKGGRWYFNIHAPAFLQ
jgi:hypothetical protein